MVYQARVWDTRSGPPSDGMLWVAAAFSTIMAFGEVVALSVLASQRPSIGNQRLVSIVLVVSGTFLLFWPVAKLAAERDAARRADGVVPLTFWIIVCTYCLAIALGTLQILGVL